MCGLASRVFLVVHGDIAGAARVARQGIGSRLADSAGETFDRLIEVFEDIGVHWGYGQDLCEQKMCHRSSSGGGKVVSVQTWGVKYDLSDDVDLGGLGMKGGDSMPT